MRSFTITRHVTAAPAEVFRAWTEPEQLTWFGDPDADHLTTVDLRPGGSWRIFLVQPDGERYWTGGTYREVQVGQRLSFSWGTAGGWPEFDPAELDDAPVITVELAALDPLDSAGPTTEMALRVSFPERISDEGVEDWLAIGIEAGWADTIDRLVQHLHR